MLAALFARMLSRMDFILRDSSGSFNPSVTAAGRASAVQTCRTIASGVDRVMFAVSQNSSVAPSVAAAFVALAVAVANGAGLAGRLFVRIGFFRGTGLRGRTGFVRYMQTLHRFVQIAGPDVAAVIDLHIAVARYDGDRFLFCTAVCREGTGKFAGTCIAERHAFVGTVLLVTELFE